MSADGRRPGLLVRAGGRVLHWVSRLAGLGPGLDAAREMAVPRPAEAARGARRRLRANLARQRELEEGDFSRVLACWGLAEEDIPAARARLARTAGAGLALTAFSLACLAAQVLLAAPLLRLAVPACASMALAGLVMALAAAWRRGVLLRRRFVPFVRWLRGGS